MGIGFAASLLVASACGGGGSHTRGDAGLDGGVSFLDGAPQPPREPGAVDLPVLTPCPTGWREVTEPEWGIVTCDPWPEGGAADCPVGQAWFPGATACAPLGDVACPAGDFADGLPDTAVYVLAGATGGDGTRERPYGRIADALAGAPAGTVVALGKGEYDETVRLYAGHSLRGACAAETILRSSATMGRAVIEVLGTGAAISDLRVGPSDLPGVRVAGAAVSLEVRRVAIAGTAYGLLAYSGAAITGSHVTVRQSAGERTGYFGFGLDVEGGGSITLDHVIADENEGALFVDGAGSVVRLRDAVLRGAHGSSRLYSFGVLVQGGGHAELTRVIVEQNLEVGIDVVHGGSSAMLDHVVVQDTVLGPGFDLGLGVNTGASVEGTRVLIQRTPRMGVIASGGSSLVRISDLVVRDIVADPTDREDDGVIAQEGARVELTRAAILRATLIGASALSPDSNLVLDHALIADTRARDDGAAVAGLLAWHGGRVTASHVRLERNLGRGAAAFAPGVLELEDTVVRDTVGRRADGFEGNGLVAGSRVELRRVRFSRNREVSIVVRSDGDVTMEDVTIEGTVARDCAETTCVGRGAGTALGVYSGGRASMTRFVIDGAPLCGIQLHGGSELDLDQGLVRNCAICACVQQPYDVGRLTRTVAYECGISYDETIPVPEPVL